MTKSDPFRHGPRSRGIEVLEPRRLLSARVSGSTTAYATIQAAVNAARAGSTVTVSAGTYAETVTVNKRLTILGAASGVDARSNKRRDAGTESVLTGKASGGLIHAAFYVTADDVTLDGFLVQGVTDPSVTKGAGIVIAPHVSGTKVLNDIVQNNVAGVFLANDSASDGAVFRHNVFRNNNKDGTNGGRAIYTDQTLSGGTLTNVTIDQNVFSNNYGGSGTTRLEAAIAFESRAGRQSQTNLKITGNVFDNDGKAVLAINVDGMRFTGNVVTHGLDFYSGIVRFEGNDHDVTITGNNLYANTGAAVAVDVKSASGHNSGFVVTGNNVYGNGTIGSSSNTAGKKLGIVLNGDAYDGKFDARYNYWGSSSGPSGDGPGTGDSIYGGPGDPSTGKWKVTATKGTELFSGWASAPVVSRDTAFWGVAATDGDRIEAEDFDLGGNGVGFYDTSGGNTGGQYRSTDVDLASTSDSGGGYVVNSTAVGEWLDYAFQISKVSVYRLDLRTASAASGAKIRILVDGRQVGADTAVPSTGSSTSFVTSAVPGLKLTSGKHTLRVMFVSKNTAGSCPALNWLRLTDASAATATDTA